MKKIIIIFIYLYLAANSTVYASGQNYQEPLVISNTSSTNTNRDKVFLLQDKAYPTDNLQIYLEQPEKIFWKDPNWWAVIIAFLIGLAGLLSLQDIIKKRFIHPVLSPTIELKPPDCHIIPIINLQTRQRQYDSYYLRFRIKNLGNARLSNVEAQVTELYEKQRNGRFKSVPDFLPLNLKWAHDHVISKPHIQSGLFHHLDFAHSIPNPVSGLNVALMLDTFITPNNFSNLIIPGKYKIKLVFSADDINPIEKWYLIELKNIWSNNEVDWPNNILKLSEVTTKN
jgi:hypothetical protein